MGRRLTRWFTTSALAIAAVTTLVVATLAVATLAVATPAAQAAAVGHAARSDALPVGVKNPCAAPTAGHATCAALTGGTAGQAAVTPAGFAPADLRNAYNLPSATGLGQDGTVAVVTAYDDPDAESDLGTYRSQYGITACTTANGCFKKVNQTGGTTYPGTSAGWSVADAQSLDMISAVCPSCHILLVEANSTAISDLGTAENEAAALGAQFIDNDWTSPESTLGSAETSDDTAYFNHPGVAITAPAGGSGYGVNYPAASPDVTAVGGTTLSKNTSVSRGWNETAWSGTGAGCSAYEPKPAWQSDTGCANRTVNDTAAVADPNTPVAYYDTPTAGGWSAGGGTDVASAVVAAAYALAGPPAPGTTPASYLYQHSGALNAITSGSDGSCSPAYLCTGGAGYNGPAGMGTPAGAAALATPGARPAAVTGVDGTSWAFARGTDGSIQADALPSGSSTWSGLTSLGGNFPGYPGALAGRGGYVWVAAVAGGSLYADYLASGSTTWSGWQNVGNAGTTLVGTPALVQDTSGNNHIFVRSTTGAIYTNEVPSGSTTWTGFTSLGGVWPDDPAAIVGSGGFLWVFAVGNTSNLYDDQLPSGSTTWTGWKSLGGHTTGVPAVIQDQAGSTKGTIRVFVRDTTGVLDEDSLPYGSTTWSGITDMFGVWQQDPGAHADSGGFDFVFLIGTTANEYYKELPAGGTWSNWNDLGGAFSGITGVAQDSAAMRVFSRATSGNLDENHLPNGSTSWSGFSSLGGPVAGS
jgi:hypothetical protein